MKYIMKWNGKIYEPYEISNKKRSELVTKMLRKLRPQVTDKFEVDSDQITELYEYLDLDMTNSADILISNQIPVPYSKIKLNLTNEKFFSYVIPQQLLTELRDMYTTRICPQNIDVFLFNEYDHKFADNAQILGFICLISNSILEDVIIFAIAVIPGSNEINILDYPLYITSHGKPVITSKNKLKENSIKFAAKLFDKEFARAWYMIQFMLLNPMIHDEYINKAHRRSSMSSPLPIADDPKPQPPRHVSPIKIVTHDIKDILTKQYSSVNRELHRKNCRHSMCWYVRGHYRNYKSGKRIYIKPSWRGPMSQMKRIQARENIIDVPKQI